MCRDPAFARRREQWGCDEPVPEGEDVFATTCPHCWGQRYISVGVPCSGCGAIDAEGKVTDEPTGERLFRQCPSAIVSASTRELSREWRLACESGILPRQGGLRDQDPAWLEGLRAFEFERGQIYAEKMQRHRD